MHFLSKLTAIVFIMLPFAAHALPEIGKAAPDFTGSASDGSDVHLSDYKGKIVVLEWNNPLCPFVKKHYGSGSMQQTQGWAQDKGVIWLAVNSGALGKEGYLNAEQANAYVADQKLAVTKYILDPGGAIGKLYGAKATPHMFVIDAKGNLAYMGAIDDKPTPDPASLPVAHNYVRTTIESLLAGQPVALVSTQAYGCSVKYGD